MNVIFLCWSLPLTAVRLKTKLCLLRIHYMNILVDYLSEQLMLVERFSDSLTFSRLAKKPILKLIVFAIQDLKFFNFSQYGNITPALALDVC